MDKPINTMVLDTAALDASILSQLREHGIEIADPTDDEEIGNACDIVGLRIQETDVSRLHDSYSEQECQDVSDTTPERPDWKPHRHSGKHKQNTRKSKRK